MSRLIKRTPVNNSTGFGKGNCVVWTIGEIIFPLPKISLYQLF